MVGIVDVNGNKIKSDALTEPQTSKVAWLYREFDSHPSRGLTPVKLARILESAEQGDIRAQHELFLDMEEKDGHIMAELGKRKRALLTVEWDIVPPRGASSEEKKQAGYVKELIQDIPNFEDVMLDALDAIGHGFSCQEIAWEMLGNEWLPKEIIHRPQTWFQTDTETRTQIRLRDMSLDGAELIPFGWVSHVHKAKSGYISRCGLHRILSWPYLFKHYSVGDLAEFLEIYGLPLRLGKYQAGASDDEKNTLLRAVMSIGHDAAGIIPEGMAVEFQEAAKGTEKPFEAMIAWCERTVSKCILGGTLTSQADGKSSTNALGKVHNEVRHDLMMSDAIQLAGTFTRDLVFPLLTLNKGGVADRRRMPKFKFMFDDSEDLGLLADALPKLVGVGMKIKLDWAHERAGIPLPEEGDELLSVNNPEMLLSPAERSKLPSETAAAKATAALAVKTDTEQESFTDDQLAARLAIEAAPHWDAILEQLRGIVNNASSLEALRDDLLASFGDLPSDDLVRVMSAGFAVAELAGMSDVADGN